MRILFMLLFASAILACNEGELSVEFIRQTKLWSYDELFLLFAGDDTSGAPVYAWEGNSSKDNTLETRTACLAGGMYTLFMTNTEGDGWDPGSNLEIVVDGNSLGHFRINWGRSTSVLLTLPLPLHYGSAWKYSDAPQTTTDWTTSANKSWEEGSYGSFNDVTATTRYFRRTMILEDYTSLWHAQLDVQTKGGFVVYLNGVAAWKYNLPDQRVTSTTPPLSDSPRTERTLGTFRGFFIHSNTVEVAVEMHNAGPSGKEAFDMRIVLTGGIEALRRNGKGSFEASHDGIRLDEFADYVFDNSYFTKWCFRFDPGDSYYVIWKMDNERREVINQYQVVTGNDFVLRDPKSWVVEASNDGVTWTTLDIQSDGHLSIVRRGVNTFQFDNHVPYNQYRFLGEGTKGSVDMLQFSEWILMAREPTTLPPVPDGACPYTHDEYMAEIKPCSDGKICNNDPAYHPRRDARGLFEAACTVAHDLFYPRKPDVEDFTSVADWHFDALEELGKTGVQYTGRRIRFDNVLVDTAFFKANFPLFKLNLDLPLTKDDEIRKCYSPSDPSKVCNWSWAYALKAMMDSAYERAAGTGKGKVFSLDFIKYCLLEEGVRCAMDRTPSDLIHLISQQAVPFEDQVAGLSALCDFDVSPQDAYGGEFVLQTPEQPNRGGLMNLMQDYPTMVLVGVKMNQLRFTGQASPPTEGDFVLPVTEQSDHPTLFALAQGFRVSVDDEADLPNGASSIGTWYLETRPMSCFHTAMNLPMIQTDDDGNFAGVAAYAAGISFVEKK